MLSAQAHGTSHAHHNSEYHWAWMIRRLSILLAHDKKDILILVSYTLVITLLSLAVPLTAQALVNTIAAGVLFQQLITLSGILLGVLCMVAIIKAMSVSLIEKLQQRIFVRVALDITERLLLAKPFLLKETYPPEHLNRFFDVVNLQKVWAKLLSDGPSSCISLLIGLILLGVYHPTLWIFDLGILLFLALAVFGLTQGGLPSSIEESHHKYALASWLQDLAGAQVRVRRHASQAFWHTVTDHHLMAYLTARKAHFHVLFRVFTTHWLFYALASVGILALGGTLVIQKQMTLGQLVASELVVIQMLVAMDKLISLFEPAFDLMTSLEKIAMLTELPLLENTNHPVNLPDTTYDRSETSLPLLALKHLHVSWGATETASVGHTPSLVLPSLTLKQGETLALVGTPDSNALRHFILKVCAGLTLPEKGLCELHGVDVRSVSLMQWHHKVAYLSLEQQGLLQGTLADNLFMGMPYRETNPLFVSQVLQLTGLEGLLAQLPEGLETPVLQSGCNIESSLKVRILLAQSLLQQPDLLLLDDLLNILPWQERMALMHELLTVAGSSVFPWSLMVNTSAPLIAQGCQRYVWFGHPDTSHVASQTSTLMGQSAPWLYEEGLLSQPSRYYQQWVQQVHPAHGGRLSS
ncbi:MAG: ATP-binding cassette domain-containing protein [Vampirovibrionales bacterium]